MTHITEVDTMASHLSDVKAPVRDTQKMTKILCTLPSSYRASTTAWDRMPATEKTTAFLTSRLLKKDTMAKRWIRGQRDAQDAAFFAHHHSSSQPMNSRDNRGSRSSRGRGGFNRRG